MLDGVDDDSIDAAAARALGGERRPGLIARPCVGLHGRYGAHGGGGLEADDGSSLVSPRRRRRGLGRSGAGVVAGCSSPDAATRAQGGGTTTSTAHGGGPPDWQTLAASLQGTVLRPGDAGYPAAGHLYNSLYTLDAAAIAQCASVSDVQRCLAFARQHDVELVAHSGGHSYAGYSSCPGLVVDVSQLQADLDRQRRRPRARAWSSVGAGSTLIDVYSQLAGQGLLLPGGSCPTVGIAGLALGGGIGVFARAYGLTCDQLASRRDRHGGRGGPALWTGTGRGSLLGQPRRWRRELRHRDLVRVHHPPDPRGDHPVHPGVALGRRGIGPRRLAPLDAVDARRAVGQLPAVQQRARRAAGWSRSRASSSGSVAACSAALAPLTGAVGTATTYRFVGPEEYLTATMIEAGCEGKPVAQCAAPVQSPFRAKSSYVGGPLPAVVVNGIVSALSSLPTTLPGAGAGVVFDGYGGQINQIGAGETAFVHRSCGRLCPVLAHLPDGATQSEHDVGGVGLARPRAEPVLAGDPGFVPELHRPDPGRLAAGLLRSEPASPPAGEAALRPRRCLPLRAVDPGGLKKTPTMMRAVG